MSVDLIKQVFIKNAYTWAVKYAKPIQVDQEPEGQITETPIKIDSFYRYVHLAKQLEGDRVNYDNVKKVLGKTEKEILSGIKEGISMYSNVKSTTPWKFDDSVYDDYTYRSYLSMLDYYNNFVYTKSFVPKHVQVIEYTDKYKDLLDIEDKLRTQSNKKRIRPNLEIELRQDIIAKYNKFDPHLLDLAQHFCPNGSQHKTSSYLYKFKNQTIELTKKDITNWIETNNVKELDKFVNMTIIDERCSLCKNLIRTAKSSAKSDKTLSVMFKKLDDIIAFYQYYETRCPKDNLHNIENGICSVCKFKTDYSKTLDIEYYNKFSEKFNKIQKEKQLLSAKTLETFKTSSYKEDVPSAKAYQFSLKKLAQWSQISEVKYNLLVNLGFFEGFKYDKIASGQVNPSKDQPNTMTRAMRLKTHILNTIRDYNIVINYENIIDVPLQIKEIIDVQKKIEVKDLSSILPKFTDFISLNNQYQKTLTIDNYVNFLLEYLANILVSLNAVPTKYATIGKLLIEYFTNKILESEKMISKPEPYFVTVDITTLENNSADEVGVSEEEWEGHASNKSEPEYEEDAAAETYENDIDNEGFDVENANDIWENE